MEIKDIFIVRPTDNEQKEFIITIGKHLATKKKFKTKEEAENYIKYPKWDTTFALIAEMIELNGILGFSFTSYTKSKSLDFKV